MCQQYKTEASMIKHNILFIGLDTHKTFTKVAYNEDQRGTKSVHLGKILSDKRDALKLAKLLKSEDLTSIYVPEPEDEAVRDLSRARETGMKDLKEAKYQLKALLLRSNINSKIKDNWSLQYLRWLAELVLPHPCQRIVLQEAVSTITERLKRLKRLDNELTHQVKC
jgi:transposase